MSLFGKAALTVAKVDGSDVYIYAGEPVHSGISPEETKRLIDGDFIVSIEDDSASDNYPDGDPSEDWTVKQLRAFAESLGLDLGDATKKADILSVLV